jgi:hypothetical protein
MATLKYKEAEVEVKYDTYGKYVPATWCDPPEYPDIEIHAVFYKGVDILPILSYEDQDEIYDSLIEYLYNL